MGLDRLGLMFAGCGSYRPEARATGVEALGRVEVAALMAGMREHEVDYVYAFMGDAGGELRLVWYVEAQVLRLARSEEWRAFDAGKVGLMARLAVQENLRNICQHCHGTGQRRFKVCVHCHGGGRARLSGRSIAERIGVDQSNFVRVWRRRYDCVYVLVQDVQSSVVSTVRRNDRLDAILLA
jgi:hypothetical protein